jgi:hypothetical protein
MPYAASLNFGFAKTRNISVSNFAAARTFEPDSLVLQPLDNRYVILQPSQVAVVLFITILEFYSA